MSNHVPERNDAQQPRNAADAAPPADDALAKYHERLRILHQIDQALIHGDSPEAIAAAALPPLRELLGVRRAIVNLFDLAHGEVEWLAASGLRRVRVGPGVRYGLEFMGDVEALRRDETQLIDVHALPPGPEVEALLASEVHSYLVVPMIARDELIGALSFGGSLAPFIDEQIDIARQVAAQFAIVLMQNRLHDQVKRHADELEERVRERTRELELAQADLRQTNVELVRRTEELTAANKELDAFSYSISHDLRAPLRAVDGFSRMLLDECAAHLPATGQRFLQRVRANAQRMGQLVDDLLVFARLSRQPLRKSNVEPATIVRQCLDELNDTYHADRAQIQVGALSSCRADPSLLKQVWSNLLGNALKYTAKRALPVIEVGCRTETSACVYFVKDNGVGFDMAASDKLFGVFQRLHASDEYEGTGVGLAIVQRIVQRHGGEIWADAKPDGGATFSFTLQGRNHEHQ